MKTGVVFDIKEFSVHDGPGIRTTVFLKGCPLACTWCHNPEGQSYKPQVLQSLAGKRTVGQSYTSHELANRLNRQASILDASEGGVTFSGGEPLAQAAFVAEVIDRLTCRHKLLDTSGYGSEDDFRSLIKRVQLVYFDLKLVEDELHCRYTGQSNKPILRNLMVLNESDVPFVIRVPLIPGVTDTTDNLAAIAERVCCLNGLVRVDLLPYNRAAGAKYTAAGMKFKPDYDEERQVNVDTSVFERLAVPVRVS